MHVLHLCNQLSCHISWTDAVDAYIILGPFDCQCFCQQKHATLRGTIVGYCLWGVDDMGGHGGRVYDTAGFPFFYHLAGCGLGCQKDAVQIDVDNFLEVFG